MIYDEARVAKLAESLDRSARTAFAAACAERLWPLVERYASVTSMSTESLRALRQSLDAVWQAARGNRADLRHAQETAETMVPYEDENWSIEAAYAQNAIAAIAYAARTWSSDDPQEAVWSARQVYEAADYASQQDAHPERSQRDAVHEHIANGTLVDTAITAIFSDFEAAKATSVDDLRIRAKAASVEFAQLLPQ